MRVKWGTAMVVAFGVSLSSFGAKGDPGPVVNWLMSEQASLFDVGMIRLQMRVASYELENAAIKDATYSWDENRIIISVISDYDAFPDEQAAEAACSKWIDSIRLSGFVDPTKGKVIIGDTSTYSSYFRHQFYETTSAPESYEERLDKIFLIRGRATLESDGSSLKTVECEGPLLGTGYSVRKQ